MAGLAPRRRHELRQTRVGLLASGARRSERDRGARWAFTYDRYRDLLPEIDGGAAAKLDAFRRKGLPIDVGVLT